MRKILTYGTFDLLHYGHINILKNAKELGDYLVVAISNDDFNRMKDKQSFFSFTERKNILEAIKYVDEVIEEFSWEQKKDDIINLEIDCLVMGDDWVGKFDDLREFCEVKYLPRTEGISTTDIKQKLKCDSIKL
ncbi:MAG: glycerol-3-phosphate cytidylyltransferase [Sarcina sp.]